MSEFMCFSCLIFGSYYTVFKKKKEKCFQSAGMMNSVTENSQSLNLLLWAFKPDFLEETVIYT